MDNDEKIRREQRMAEEMIRLPCEKRHGSRGALCADCAELLGYVHARCERCPHRPDKPFCSNCKTHCCKPAMREKIRIMITVTLLMSIGFSMMNAVPAGQIVLACVWLFHIVYFAVIVKTRVA